MSSVHPIQEYVTTFLSLYAEAYAPERKEPLLEIWNTPEIQAGFRRALLGKEKKTAGAELGKKKETGGPKPYYTVELAKSGRAGCRGCKEKIPQKTARIGKHVLIDQGGRKFRSALWYHPNCLPHPKYLPEIKGWDVLPEQVQVELLRSSSALVKPTPVKPLTFKGKLNMSQLEGAITNRYKRFRSFSFGLPDSEMYSKNWNWRCFVSTMLCCNTREENMLTYVTHNLFKKFPTPEKLAAARDQVPEIIEEMKKGKIRHAPGKALNIVNNTRLLLEEHSGEVPKTRGALQRMRGVGRHVSSVVMAWVHEKGEFGIDVHVTRIMERWKMISPGDRDLQVEKRVKQQIPKDKIGAFSRAFVDLGQDVCGFTPNCGQCFLRGSCPSAQVESEATEGREVRANLLEW